MANPLVSVIIPNYNHARFLDERIQSVLSQTYQNFEVIILDDKSTDNSIDVINKYKDDSHITHIIVNEENSGSPFKQWDKGFELAKGEWIWIAESDDSSEPQFLEELMAHVDDETSFAFCRSKRMDQHGAPVYEYWQDELKDSFTMDGQQFIDDYLRRKCIVWNASSVIFRRDNVFQIPKDYMGFKAAGDWLYWICLARLGNVSFVNTPLNRFRLHNTNTTQQSIQSGLVKVERAKLYHYLISNGYISRQYYRKIRMNDINNLFIYSNLEKESKEHILDMWEVSNAEQFFLWMKKQCIRLRDRFCSSGLG